MYFLIAEKPLGELDLIYGPHSERFAAQDGAAHFKAGDRLLQKKFPVMAEGLLHGGGELVRGCCPGDAEGGPGPDGLDKERIAQSLRRLGDGGEVRAPAEYGAFGHTDAGLGGQQMGPDLVHPQRAGKGSAADHRHVRELEQALNRAVLPVFAMKHREYGLKGQAAAIGEK